MVEQWCCYQSEDNMGIPQLLCKTTYSLVKIDSQNSWLTNYPHFEYTYTFGFVRLVVVTVEVAVATIIRF